MIIQSNDGKLSDLIRDFKKFTSKPILQRMHNEPESRREWMLERFKLATESHTRNKNYQFWHWVVMQKKFIQKNSCGQK